MTSTELSEGPQLPEMVAIVVWERRKLQLVAAFASKPVVVRYNVAS